jgi:hypothetical protein
VGSSGLLQTKAKGRDHVTVRDLDSHLNVIPRTRSAGALDLYILIDHEKLVTV